jgi:hypothetical protein
MRQIKEAVIHALVKIVSHCHLLAPESAACSLSLTIDLSRQVDFCQSDQPRGELTFNLGIGRA